MARASRSVAASHVNASASSRGSVGGGSRSARLTWRANSFASENWRQLGNLAKTAAQGGRRERRARAAERPEIDCECVALCRGALEQVSAGGWRGHGLRHREELVGHVPMPMKRLCLADREAGKVTLEHINQKMGRSQISGVGMHAKVWHGNRKCQRAPPNWKDADAMNI